MFSEGSPVVAAQIPPKDQLFGLGRAILNKRGKVVADPPHSRVNKATPIEGYTDVDFRNPYSKDAAPMIYRVPRSWLSRGGQV